MAEQLYQLPTLSDEQSDVITQVKEGFNVKVSGVAGCGKTTTILAVCASNPEKQVLVLTYNARLKLETREKADKLGLLNTEIHSYHAMCVRYYSHKGAKDDGIIQVIKDDMKPKKEMNYDIIILDECQDMTKLYFNFVNKIVKDNNAPGQEPIIFCIFGDEKQNIFEFKGADERFLTYGHLILKNERTWKELTVHTSFRITNQIARFINKYLIGYEKLRACKEGSKVRYLYINCFQQMNLLYSEVMHYLRQGFKNEDIFILAPSIKKSAGGASPVVKLENMLVNAGIPCFAPVSDDSKIDEDVIKGKIVFSTFHQVKGLERPVVIIFNFDFSYFKYYARNLPQDKCPNIIYVATTRALQHLTVIHGTEHHSILPSITYDAITRDPDVRVIGEVMSKDQFGNITPQMQGRIPVKVTELIRFLDAQVIYNATKMLDYSSLQGDEKLRMSLPQKAECTSSNSSEIVFDINGYAIPAFYEMQYCKTLSILNGITYDTLDDKQKNTYNKLFYKFGQGEKLSCKALLYLSTLYDACVSGYKHRTKQITSYDWIKEKDFVKCCDVLKTHISGDIENITALKFEVPLKGIPFLNSKYELWGQVDILNYETNTLWEIKCTSSVDNEHIIQMAIYAWMIYSQQVSKRVPVDARISHFKLLNVCKNELVTLFYDHEKITSMIDYLLRCKYEVRRVLTDSEFIADCNNCM